MSALGHDQRDDGAAAALGRCIAEFYIVRGLDDGSNEGNDYASAAYRPVNPYLDPEFSGNADLIDPDRWQPMGLRLFVDQAGNLADGGARRRGPLGRRARVSDELPAAAPRADTYLALTPVCIHTNFVRVEKIVWMPKREAPRSVGSK